MNEQTNNEMTQTEIANNEHEETQEVLQKDNQPKETDMNNDMLRRMMFNSGMYCMHDYISVLNKDK